MSVTSVVSPLSAMLCVVDGLAFRSLSVRVTEPANCPEVAGVKSTARLQLAPAASVPAEYEDVTSGQVVDESKAKFAETLGFWPEPGTGKVNGALPTLRIVTDCASPAHSCL